MRTYWIYIYDRDLPFRVTGLDLQLPLLVPFDEKFLTPDLFPGLIHISTAVLRRGRPITPLDPGHWSGILHW